MEFYSAKKKNAIMPFTGKWIELDTIIVSEISQTQKVKGHVFSHMQKLEKKKKKKSKEGGWSRIS